MLGGSALLPGAGADPALHAPGVAAGGGWTHGKDPAVATARPGAAGCGSCWAAGHRWARGAYAVTSRLATRAASLEG
jgi:hypothetical protein